MKNRPRQSENERIQPDSGAVMIEEIGMFIIQIPNARARSRVGNQWLISTRIAGQIPPSATPRKKRTTSSWVKSCTTPDRIAKMPQATIMIATNFLALQRSARWPPGIWSTR